MKNLHLRAKGYSLYLIFLCLFFVSCDRTHEYPVESVSFNFSSSFSLSSISKDGLQSLMVLRFDKDTCVAQVNYFDQSDLKSGILQAEMAIGEYLTLFVANVNPETFQVKKNENWNDLRISLPQEVSTWQSATDVCWALQKIKVEYNVQSNPMSIELKRQIGFLQVDVVDIPQGVTRITVQLENVPSQLDLRANGYSKVQIPNVKELSSSMDSLRFDFYSFPWTTGDKTKLRIYYVRNQVTYSSTYDVEQALGANQVMRVVLNYSESTQIELSPDMEHWADSIIDGGSGMIGGSDDVVSDDRLVVGVVGEENLLANGDFELEEVVAGWGFSETSGKDNVVVPMMEGVRSGEIAVRLEGKTYFYQDVAVGERKGYQVKLWVKALSESTKWRCYCRWMKNKSTALSASFNEAVQTGYRYRTEGWEEVFAGNDMFRAPVGAKYLRIEFRTFSEYIEGDGLCVDDLAVYEVQE